MAIVVSAAPVQTTSCKLTYLLTADGAPGPNAITLDNAALQTACTGGPLLNALNSTYADQAAMRAVFGGGSVRMWVRPRSEAFAVGVDVDVDAVTATKPEVNVVTTGVLAAGTAYLDIEFVHSAVK